MSSLPLQDESYSLSLKQLNLATEEGIDIIHTHTHTYRHTHNTTPRTHTHNTNKTLVVCAALFNNSSECLVN